MHGCGPGGRRGAALAPLRAKAVREERSADDGSIELLVELAGRGTAVLARTPGVQILEVQGPDMPCAPGDAYLQSTAVSSATYPGPALGHDFSYIWRGINLAAVRTIPGDGGLAKAVLISTNA